MRLTRVFKFDSAHNLVRYHGKCEKLHGHTYKMTVTVVGNPDEDGLIIDFIILKKIIQEKVLSVLDHSYLNDFIEQPTAENIAVWVWSKIEKDIEAKGVHLYEIQIWETAECFVSYFGD